jgi:cell wall-associated NlpC family hydrolase
VITGISDTRTSLVEYALQFVGNPYVWGGTSLTRGVDCSGFTMQVYAHYGISLPHHSASQPSYGKRISASQAQPGDLFFYGSGSINHVGIYIGNGKIVHASNARTGITISSAYYRTPVCVVSYLK